MRFLKQNTATRVTVGPFFDKTDGITPEVALTVTNEKLTFMVDDGGVPTLVIDAAPTASGGTNDMVHVTNDDAGFYDLELTAAQTNYVGRAMLALTDAANHCPVFHEFMIAPANVYDSLFGTDLLDTNVSQWNGTAVPAELTAGYPQVTVKTAGGENGDVSNIKSGLATPANILGAAVPGAYGAGTLGYLIGTYVDAAITSRLAPTVAARTLDVSAGGEAGVDWANVGTPGSTVNLSATTVKTLTDPVAKSPATLAVADVSGNLPANVIQIESGDATDALTAAATAATPTVTLANGAHGGANFTLTGKSVALTNSDGGGNALALVANGAGGTGLLVSGTGNDITADLNGTVAVAVGGITTTSFDPGALTNAVFGADAIDHDVVKDAALDNAKFAADVELKANVTKINSTTVQGDGGKTVAWGPA